MHGRLSSQYSTEWANDLVLANIAGQESESNIIDLSHDTKRIVFRMVEFVYRGDYDVLNYPDYPTTDKDTPDGSKVRHAVLHADMFTVADKYDIVALGEKAKEHFEETIDSWSLDDSEFLEVTKYVYSTTPESDRGLRDAIVRETRLRGSQIIKDTGLKPRLEELVSTTPHFAWDLFHNSLQENSVGKESNPNGETSQAESETFGLFD